MKHPEYYNEANRFPSVGTRIAFYLSMSCAMALPGTALGATKTWDGGTDSDSHWSAGENWDLDTPPQTGDDLVFSGTTNLFPDNNLEDTPGSGAFSVNSLTFDATAGGFLLLGFPINVNGKTVTNNSTELQEIYPQLKETGGGITVDGPGDLYFDDIHTSSYGKTLTKNGAGKVEIALTNDSWKLVLNNGTLVWDNNILFGTHDIKGGTLKSGKTNVFHYNSTVRLLNTTVAPTTPATFNMLGNALEEFKILEGAAGSIITNQGSTGETTTLTITGNGDSRTFSGSFQDGSLGGKTGLRLKSGNAQTLVLTGANTHTGGTTVEAGTTLSLTSAGSLRFKPQPAGVCNKVTGGGTASMDGTFNIDLSAVGTPSVGASWTLVESTATYGTNFLVAAPFAETALNSGKWSYFNGTNTYYFSESSGTLSYGRTAETVWKGLGGDDLWSTSANWDQSPLTGDILVFDGSTQTTNTNNLDTNYIAAVVTPATPEDLATFFINGIRFEPTAASFTLQGNSIEFSGKTITNNSTNPQTFAATIQTDNLVSGGAFTVNTAAGNVTLNGVGMHGGGFSKPLIKTGSQTLFVNGPLVGPDTYGPQVQQGTLVANWSGGNLFFNTTISAGATLRYDGTNPNGVIHNGANVTANGTLDLAGSVNEDIGILNGSGVVTSHGLVGTTSTLSMRCSSNQTFSGTIKDGTSGGKLSVKIGIYNVSPTNSLSTASSTWTLSGANTYTGDTVFPQSTGLVSLNLASTGSLTFKIGANGVNNKIVATSPQTTGTVALNGTFNFDLSGAEILNNNSWLIVDVANLNESFDPTTFVVGGGFVKNTPTVGQWQMTEGANTWTFTQSTGVLSLATGGAGSYTTWAATWLPAVIGPASADFDNDGLTNLMEYALGKNPTVSSTPAGTYDKITNTVSFPKGTDAYANGDVTWAIERSDDLGATPWTPALPLTTNDSSSISYALPPGFPKVFVRLKVLQP